MSGRLKGVLKQWIDAKREKNELIFLDGSFAFELKKAVNFENHPGWTAFANFMFMDEVQRVHETYINIGCDFITTNTYHHSIDLLSPLYGEKSAKETFKHAVNTAHLARFAQRNEDNVKILLSIGSYATKLRDGSEYSGSYGATVDPSLVDDYYEKQLSCAEIDEYDGLIFETIPAKIDVVTIVKKIENTHDVIVSFCLDKLNLRDGTPLREVIALMIQCDNIIGIGINCTDPTEGIDQINEIVRYGWVASGKHIFIYPNSGEHFVNGRYRGERTPLHELVRAWHEAGAIGIGGCCRVGKDQLLQMRNVIYDINKVTEIPVRFRPSPKTILPRGWFDVPEEENESE